MIKIRWILIVEGVMGTESYLISLCKDDLGEVG